MCEPQDGSIANGSWRRSPSPPNAAAVFSEPIVAPTNTPCFQSRDSYTSGTVVARRPPKRTAEIGTPFGSSHSSAITGHCDAGAQKREFGCAAGVSDAGDQSLRFQSVRCAGGAPSMPSHQTSPSSVSATFVNTVFASSECIAFGLVSMFVPGATPKNPYSGLIAWRRPSGPNFIQAMSSPIVSAFQPGIDGMSMARLVLPHADGNAAAM